MPENENDPLLAEFGRIKKAMLKTVYGSCYCITQDSGRVLKILSLFQQPTYLGMMEGLPRKSHNDSQIESYADSGDGNKNYVLHAPRLYTRRKMRFIEFWRNATSC